MIEKRIYIMVCDRCGKRQEYHSLGKLLHDRIPSDKLPRGWHYILVDDLGWEPYMKMEYPTKKELMVCDACK